MPCSIRSNKENQLLFSPDPASLERSIRKEAHSLSTDNNTSVSLDFAQPPSTQTPIPSTDSRSPLSIDNTNLPSTDIIHPTSIDIPSRTSIDTEPRDMVAPLILARDNNGDLHDQEGHLRNAAGTPLPRPGRLLLQLLAMVRGRPVSFNLKTICNSFKFGFTPSLAFVVSESLACRPSLSLPVHSHHLVPTTQKTPPFFIHQPANSFGSSFPLHQIQGHYSFFFTDHTAHRQPVLAPASSLSSSLQILFCLLLLRTILCPIFAPTPNRLRWSSHELPDRSGPYVPYGLALSLHTRPFSSTICF
ncbi:hypothetical protein F2Q68_00020618 [Brassica cretica]|uniref:Uncharacterized protein n=1 Tax=Brassica cretica TaxID=69181 RepID=A0A8S9FST7_BRACR|nr:hypothetical protein F2Q68_00020618 [Brassica cretica]